MTTLSLSHLGKWYGKNIHAVADVNIEIAAGEFVVIVGPSGCGKSTLLRMVAGLEAISEGELRIDDEIVNQHEPKQRGVAMVFQNYALYPHMSNRQNMGYALKLAGLKKAEINRRVEAVAEKLQLTPYLDRKPSQLSGGQRQRVAMGRAIVREPKVFLFDEPLSNLDAKLRVEMRKQIKQLQRELGITSLYVTHDQVEAMTMADRLIVLKDGKVQQIGTPMTLYQQPANRFVAEFIGSPPMNIIEGVTINNSQATLANGTKIDCPDYAGQGEVLLGIRPENVQIYAADNGDTNGFGITFIVDIVEHLGGITLLNGHLDGLAGDFIVSCQNDTAFSEGQALHLHLPGQHLCLFTSDGEAVLAP